MDSGFRRNDGLVPNLAEFLIIGNDCLLRANIQGQLNYDGTSRYFTVEKDLMIWRMIFLLKKKIIIFRIVFRNTWIIASKLLEKADPRQVMMDFRGQPLAKQVVSPTACGWLNFLPF
jgi:hypothetical protein